MVGPFLDQIAAGHVVPILVATTHTHRTIANSSTVPKSVVETVSSLKTWNFPPSSRAHVAVIDSASHGLLRNDDKQTYWLLTTAGLAVQKDCCYDSIPEVIRITYRSSFWVSSLSSNDLI